MPQFPHTSLTNPRFPFLQMTDDIRQLQQALLNEVHKYHNSPKQRLEFRQLTQENNFGFDDEDDAVYNVEREIRAAELRAQNQNPNQAAAAAAAAATAAGGDAAAAAAAADAGGRQRDKGKKKGPPVPLNAGAVRLVSVAGQQRGMVDGGLHMAR